MDKVRKILSFILVCIIYSGIHFVEAQNQKFRIYSVEQGLSQSTVNCIIQDKQGFIWFGTQDGLNKFDGYDFRLYKNNPENSTSIPDNFIQALFVDNEGLIWIGTYGGGLSSFNPVNETFTNYKHQPSDLNSLTNNKIMTICQDANEHIWIGTLDGGVNKFNKKTKTFKLYFFNNPDEAAANQVKTIYCDSKQHIWLGTNGAGLYLYDAITDKFIPFSEKTKIQVWGKKISTVFEDKSGKIWIGSSDQGITTINPNSNSSDHFLFNETKNSFTSNNDVTSINQDNNGIFWIGTFGNGLYQYDPASKKLNNYTNDILDINSLSHNSVISVFKDISGALWIGTIAGGVNYFEPGRNSFLHYGKSSHTNESLSESVVMAIYEDNGEIYIGTYGGGLNVFDTKTRKYTYFFKGEGAQKISSNIIRCIFKDSNQKFWIGTYNGGLNLFDKKTKTFIKYSFIAGTSSQGCDDIWCIKEDKNGHLWLGTWGGLIDFDPNSGAFIHYKHENYDNSLGIDRIISLNIDEDGIIWIGTNGNGLDRFDPAEKTFVHYRPDADNKTSLNNDRVRAILIDKLVIWLGTDGGGLNRFDKNKKTFVNYTDLDGLPNNVVYGIVKDKLGMLWLSTNHGLCRFDPVNCNVIRNYDLKDGLQSNEFNQGAFFISKNGTIYFGGINGFNAFDPGKLRSNSYIPPVYITSIKLRGKEIISDTSFTYRKSLQLNYNDNFISFEFSALNFSIPENNSYEVKMEGFDKDYIKLNKRKFISYTNLDPGSYVFRVKAANNDGVWNEEGAALLIVIKPPFWKTIWFQVLEILVGLGLIILFITLRTRKLRKDKKVLEDKVVERTAEIQQQKKEIKTQRDEIEAQRDMAAHQRDMIGIQNKVITDSIHYAKLIQEAILPSNEILFKIFPDSFIFFKPKAIVSGDFYWISKPDDNTAIFASVDCTGHGVPGALMSMIGYNMMNQAINILNLRHPKDILNYMNTEIHNFLHKNSKEYSIYDGMDLALCKLHLKEMLLEFGGAHNPLIIIRNNELMAYKPDRFSIGQRANALFKSFSNTEIQLQKGDCLYLFSDGFHDQFDKSNTKKYTLKRFKQELLSVHNLSMEDQKAKLSLTFDSWKGSNEQIDDVIVLGIRI